MKIFLFYLLILSLFSCGSGTRKYEKSPIDEIVTTYIDQNNYSVILSDMDYNESEDKYLHKYKIILEEGNSIQNTDTTSANNDIKIINL